MPDEEGRAQVVIKDETIWCTQQTMALLFDIDNRGLVTTLCEGMMDREYEKLPLQERFFVDYGQCYYDNGDNPDTVSRLIYNWFIELLNKHWVSRKIRNFEESRLW